VKQIHKRLTYANVMSSLAVFLFLGGATAIAALKVPKHSVGPRQLKANAVTTPKIKANAVTTRKIKKNAVATIKIRDNAVTNAKLDDDAVTTAKIAKEAVTGAKIDSASTPFGRIVHEARGTSTESLPNATLTVYPLINNVYTQAAGRDDLFIGGLEVVIPASCTSPRSVTVGLLVDPVDPEAPKEVEFVAQRTFADEGADPLTTEISIGPAASFQPTAATNRTLYLAARAECAVGGGITATSGGIDVIGTSK
jgi:hypothetical protein